MTYKISFIEVKPLQLNIFFTIKYLLVSNHQLYFQGIRVLNSHSVVSDSSWPHRLEPTRILCPWDFPDKNIGVGGHFLLQEY